MNKTKIIGTNAGMPTRTTVTTNMLENGQMVTIDGTIGNISYGSENYR